MPLNLLLKDKNQKLMAFITTSLLILVLGNYLGVIYWQIKVDKPDVSNQLIAQVFKPTVNTANKQQPIAPLHLFGKANQVVPVNVVKKTTVAPISRLNLTLKGVFASEPADSSLAIISSGRQDELMYAVGETLPGGATLKEVYNDKVIIERNGSLETLLLSLNEAKIATNFEEPLQTEQIFRSTPKELRVQLLKNPTQIPKIMATIPQYKNGKIIGYKLKMKKYQGILEQYGLQQTDIVTSINGIDITKPSNAFKLLQQLTNAQSLNLNILRGGRRETLNISLL